MLKPKQKPVSAQWMTPVTILGHSLGPRQLVFTDVRHWSHMATNYVLVDFENVQPDMSGLVGTAHKVVVFFGAKQQEGRHHFEKFDALFELGANLERVKILHSGKNALDMHIAWYIGKVFEREPAAVVHVVSRDTDFDPLIEYLRKQGFACSRSKDVDVIARQRGPSVPAMGAVPRKAKAKSAPAAPAPPKKTAPDQHQVIVRMLRALGNPPKTRKALVSTLANYLKQQGTAQSTKAIEQAIDELIRQKLVSQNGTKMAYTLGF